MANSRKRDPLTVEQELSERFEEALQAGRIRPYYQPVIRTISGTLCGYEALARWEDPELGLLLPEDFFPVLKKKALMTRLDRYLLDQVCRDLNDIAKQGYQQVPISVNLYGSDFVTHNMPDEVERIVSRHGIARDLIRIELTEDLINENPEVLKKEIARLRDGGYQVFLDDFGSGLSSLKILKEQPVDLVKLDRFFLEQFNEHSKELIRSVIRMVKELGIQTLAKGVETEEQYEFLRSIGCETVQGYFFDQPRPGQELYNFVREKKIPIETRAWRCYYDQIGRVDFLTDRPMAIIEFDQKQFSFLYRNEEHMRVCASLKIFADELSDYMINSPSSTLSRKFRYFQNHTRLGMEYSQMDFSISGQYFRIKSRRICENMSHVANQIELYNMMMDDAENKNQQLDQVFRAMYSMYDVIYLVQSDGTYENLMRSNGTADPKKLEEERIVVDRNMMKTYIHPDDQVEFMEFSNPETLMKRLQHTEGGYQTGYFRSRFGSAGYVWKAHTYQYLPDTDMLIFSSRQAPLYQKNLVEKIAPGYLGLYGGGIEHTLGIHLMESKTVPLFWKDTTRRFSGANHTFLTHFALEDQSSLIGRTDEELNWLVDSRTSMEDDHRMLTEGVAVRNRVEQCIIQGIPHTILVSKEPVYLNGKIAGILGTFTDMEEIVQRNIRNGSVRDEWTGLLSAHSMVDIVSVYAEGWSARKEQFAVIRITFLEQKQNYAEYGSAISKQIACEISRMLKQICGNEAVIARLYAGTYSILMRYLKMDDVTNLIRRITETMKQIHQIAGYPVTIYPQMTAYYSETAERMSELIAAATGGSKVDLAQRRKLEDKLHYYNVQMETVVDAIPGGIAMYEIIDEDVRLIYASHGIGAISGRSIREFRSEFAKDRCAGMLKQDMKLLHDACMKAVRERSDLDVTYRLRHVNGSVLWVNMKGRVIGEQNGHPILMAVFRNLSENTTIYEKIMDEALISIFVSAKTDGEILYTNQSGLNLSKRFADGCPEKMYRRLMNMCSQETRTDNEYNDEGRVQYEVLLENRNLLIYHVDGIWNGRSAEICYVSDITAKYIEEREQAARESLLYLQAINSSYDMIVTFNLTKNTYQMKPGRNFLGFDWSGYENYDGLVTTMKQLVPEDDGDFAAYCLANRQRKEYAAGRRFFDFEHRIYDAAGALHWVSERIVYAEDPASGDIIGISLTMLIDDRIRERNEQKEMLQKALDVAMEANQAKSRFLSNISHDIRTPMNAIMGYSAIAAAHTDDSARIQDCINKILISGRHLEELINDVLDLSRIEAGKESLEVSPVSLKELESDVAAIIHPLAEKKQICLLTDTDEVVHQKVLADSTKLRRIMINILGNAVKFTGEQGRIECKLSERPGSRDGFGFYTVRVKDNGIGMSREFVSHIFEMFAREQDEDSQQIAGTGLGMAITKRYVDLMEGSIHVESEQHIGTEVIVELELKWDQSEDLPDPKVSQKMNLTGKCVLVVDDNELNQDISCMLLKDLGIITDTASDGREAVRLLEQCDDHTYDYVLMDVRMPVMNGIEAAKRIRSSKRTYLRQVPIIAVTANAFRTDISACLNAGMNSHIAKPFTAEDLLRQFEQLQGIAE